MTQEYLDLVQGLIKYVYTQSDRVFVDHILDILQDYVDEDHRWGYFSTAKEDFNTWLEKVSE